MKQSIKTLALSSLFGLGLSITANAQIAGHNVILVHGFTPDHLINHPDAEAVKVRGESYWSDYWGQHAEARLDWPSHKRIEGGIATALYNQAIEISKAGTCNQGCVLVTHSTGDLVARYFLENQDVWLDAAGLAPLNIIASLDFAGAGGGTEVADLAISVANSDNWFNSAAKNAVETAFGVPVSMDNLGVMQDLQVNVARNTATAPNNIPRLRFVGAGSDFLGVTSPFITGKDDGMVPSHSACGASANVDVESCASDVAFDGALTSMSAPGDFYHNHYPVLMGDGTSHSDTINNKTNQTLTIANNQFNAGLNVDIKSHVASSWYWWYDYRYVNNSDNKAMSEVVFNSLN